MNIDSITKSEVKHLVNHNQWATLGIWFNFTPVYHEGCTRFIDWRCIPESLMLVLQGPKKSSVPDNAYKHPSKWKSKRPKPYDLHRLELYEIQGGVCHYCKHRVATKYEWSIDHRLPYARGGTNASQNRIGCCKPCNNQKGPLTEEEFFALKPGTNGIKDRCKKAINAHNFAFFPKPRA